MLSLLVALPLYRHYDGIWVKPSSELRAIVFLYSRASVLSTFHVCNHAVLPSFSEICSLPRSLGFGRESWARFYFNDATGYCEKFRYRGSGGNLNNFVTYKGCSLTCFDRGKNVQSLYYHSWNWSGITSNRLGRNVDLINGITGCKGYPLCPDARTDSHFPGNERSCFACKKSHIWPNLKQTSNLAGG